MNDTGCGRAETEMTDRKDMTDDELLSAFADGELAADEAERLRWRIAAEPALARRLQQMRQVDHTVRSVYAAVDDAPMPQRVLDLLEPRDQGRTDEEPADNVVALPMRGPRRFFQMPVAIAASVALVAGFLVAELFEPGAVPDAATRYSGTIAGNTELHRFLETGLSGEPHTLASGADGRIVLTFQTGAGDWCRQFRLADAGSTMHALACRSAGSWQMETASFAPPGAPGGPYSQAGAETPAALDAAVRARIGARAPLDRSAETLLISNNWENSGE